MEPCAFTWENDALSEQASQSIIHARLSLGLSIGLVPAARGIVTAVLTALHATRFTPACSSLCCSACICAARAYSPLNVTLTVILMGLFMLKSVI